MIRRWFSLAALALLPALGLAQVAAPSFQEGVHYLKIDPPQPGTVNGKIEVVEAFSYACNACAAFEPHAASWRKTRPADVQFTLLPVQFNPTWEMFARAYYAAEALGIVEQGHQAMFDGVHVKRDLRTLEDVSKLYANYGKTAQQFLAATKSFGVEAKLKRAKLMAPRYQIEGTPTLIVAGKYRVTTKSAGSYPKMFEVANFLIARERAAAAAPVAVPAAAR